MLHPPRWSAQSFKGMLKILIIYRDIANTDSSRLEVLCRGPVMSVVDSECRFAEGIELFGEPHEWTDITK